MNIQFKGETIEVHELKTTPGRFKIGDIITGPAGILLEVATVQKAVPCWSKFNRSAVKTVVIFQSESDTLVPVNGMSGEYSVYRR